MEDISTGRKQGAAALLLFAALPLVIGVSVAYDYLQQPERINEAKLLGLGFAVLFALAGVIIRQPKIISFGDSEITFYHPSTRWVSQSLRRDEIVSFSTQRVGGEGDSHALELRVVDDCGALRGGQVLRCKGGGVLEYFFPADAVSPTTLCSRLGWWIDRETSDLNDKA